MFKRIVNDIDSVFARDPAARSRLEVILCYPGLHAILFHRLSHWLWARGLKLPDARTQFVAAVMRSLSGVT